MKQLISVLVLLLWIASAAAGPNEGGVLVVHHDPSAIETNACGSIVIPSSCAELDPTAESIEEPVLWFVLAAFPDSVPDRFNTITFGLGNYNNTNLVMGDWGPCELLGQPLEIPSDGWPGPNTGTSVSWAPTCGSGQLIPMYWFLTYAYAPGTVPLGDHYPGQSSAFVSCASPPEEDLITEFGAMGLGTAGLNSCAEIAEQGNGPDQGYQPDFPEDGNGNGNSEYEPPPLGTQYVTIKFSPGAIQFDRDDRSQHQIDQVTFNPVALRDSLLSVGATEINYSFPGFFPEDTLASDINGRPVVLNDLSRYFTLEYPTPEAAAQSIWRLVALDGVEYADVFYGNRYAITDPNDPFYEEWTWFEKDAQWHLSNEGLRNEDDACGEANAGFDNNIEAVPLWAQGFLGQDVAVGIVDVGIKDDHEDLDVINDEMDDPSLYTRFPTNPELDFCGDHGTKMAGVAAAITNNSRGIAGVCPNCNILDIMVPSCTSVDSCLMVQADPDADVECDGFVWPFWLQWVDNLLLTIDDVPAKLVALNFSFAKSIDISQMELLWNFHKCGVTSVWSSGNTAFKTAVPLPGQNRVKYPETWPFCLGAGGYTWRGDFWDRNATCFTVCDDIGICGEPVVCCPDTFGTTVGRRNISVCAPASQGFADAHPWAVENLPPYYALGGGATSGAAAQVSGAVGLLQSLHEWFYGGYLSPDDVMGIIEASATPWHYDPAAPDSDNYVPYCEECTTEDYGRGRLNLTAAWSLLDYYYLEDVVTAGEFSHNQEDDVSFFNQYDNSTWVRQTLVATVQVPSTPGQPFPEYIAWVRRARSNTYPFYNGENVRSLLMALVGINDCYITTPNATGQATITGYLYGRLVDGEIVYEDVDGNHLTSFEDARMAWTRITDNTANAQSDYGNTKTLSVSIPQNPVRFPLPIAFRLQSQSAVTGKIFDVRGRVIRELFVAKHARGMYNLKWDGLDDSGHEVASGVYWLVLEAADERVVRQLTIVR